MAATLAADAFLRRMPFCAEIKWHIILVQLLQQQRARVAVVVTKPRLDSWITPTVDILAPIYSRANSSSVPLLTRDGMALFSSWLVRMYERGGTLWGVYDPGLRGDKNGSSSRECGTSMDGLSFVHINAAAGQNVAAAVETISRSVHLNVWDTPRQASPGSHIYPCCVSSIKDIQQ